jgi:RsiW-degrading membrane proteinase PrsW (M82 family)
MELALTGPLLGDGSSVSSVFLYSFIGIALVEEGFKYWVLKRITWKSVYFNERFDGIVYGVAVSLGFAAFENILYVMGGGMSIGILRAFAAVPMHAVLGVLMGVAYGKAKFEASNARALLFRSLAIPTFYHGLYDFFALSSGTGQVDLSGLLFILLIALVIYAFKVIKWEVMFKANTIVLQSEEEI